MSITWGKHVDGPTLVKVRSLALSLGCQPGDLLTCMAFETGRSFSPSIRNAAGSGAVGLIQFMPSTAAALGTTIERLAGMTAARQMDYVTQYFRSWTGKLHNLGDVYGAILWPGMIGKADSYVLWTRTGRPTAYLQNKGLDVNHDGAITRGEVLTKIYAMQTEGLRTENAL